MIERYLHPIGMRGLMAAACLVLLAGCGESGLVQAPAVLTPQAPAIPTDLAATPGNAQATLAWSPSSGATSYQVKRGMSSGGPYTQIASAATPSYTDSTVTNGTTYFFVVAAVGSGGRSDDSAQASVTPVAAVTIPAVPMNLVATAGNAQVTLTWSVGTGATSYRVKRSTTSGGPYAQVATSASTAYTDTTLTNGTIYYYVVSAVNSVGEGTNSGQATATPTAPGGTSGAIASINVTPANMFVLPNATQQYVAVAVNQSAVALATQPSLSWSASGGTISATGLYTAPATPGTYTITAQAVGTSVAGGTTVTVGAAGTCASVPAAGTWDQATVSPVIPATGTPPYIWTGKTMALVVDPFTPSTVYLGTGGKGLFKSTSCGAAGSWVKLDTGTNHDVLDSSNLWSMQVDPDPSRKGVMYALTSYGANGGLNGLYKSVNGGVDWTPVQIGSGNTFAGCFWNNLAMDSSNTLHLAVTTHGGTSVAGYTNGAIAESFDGGKTWPNISQTPVIWGEGGGVYLIPGTTVGTKSTWVWGGDFNTGSYVSTDSGATWPSQYKLSAAVVGENQILPLQRATNGWLYLPAVTSVLKSMDGVNWSTAWGVTNQTPRPAGFAITDTTIYTGSDHTMYSGPLSNDTSWGVMAGPPMGSEEYIGFMAYDKAHGILYVATWWSVYRYSVPTSSR